MCTRLRALDMSQVLPGRCREPILHFFIVDDWQLDAIGPREMRPERCALQPREMVFVRDRHEMAQHHTILVRQSLIGH